jgi:hypothetical protein
LDAGTTTEGPAISRALSAALAATLITLLAAGSAQARPSFGLDQSSARAGDVVHFTIAGVDGWGVAYHLELGGRDLISGRSKSSVAGSFTMPDLGDDARAVSLDAWIWWSNTKARTQRSLDYRGRALPPPDPPAPPPVPAPPVSAPAVPVTPATGPLAGPSPGPAGQPAAAVTSPSHAARPRANVRRRRSASRHGTAAPAHARSGGARLRAALRARARRARHAAAAHRRSRHARRHIAPLPRGVPTPQAGLGAGEEPAKPATQSAPATRRVAAHDRIGTSVVVPAVLTLGALMLLATAVLRRRWLAARAAQS